MPDPTGPIYPTSDAPFNRDRAIPYRIDEDDLPTPALIAETFETGRTMALGQPLPEDIAEALETLWTLIATLPEPHRGNCRAAAAHGAANPSLADPVNPLSPNCRPPLTEDVHTERYMKTQAYRRHVALVFLDPPEAAQPGPRSQETGALLYSHIAASLTAAQAHIDAYEALPTASAEEALPTVRWHQPHQQRMDALARISRDMTDPEAVVAHSALITRGMDHQTAQTIHGTSIPKHPDTALLYHTAVNACFQAEDDHRLLAAILAPADAPGPNRPESPAWLDVATALARIDYAKGLETHATNAAVTALNERVHRENTDEDGLDGSGKTALPGRITKLIRKTMAAPGRLASRFAPRRQK